MTTAGFADRVAAAAGSPVLTAEMLDGGAVGTVRRVDLADGRALAAKTGDVPLSVEGAMLRYLAAHTDLPVPAVEHASDGLLLLEYVTGDDPLTPAAERDLADRVAALHGVTAERAGFPFDTLSGPFRQPNPRVDSWVEFYREFRLRHAVEGAVADGVLAAADRERVGALADDLDGLITEPTAHALLHGDLWSGNVLVADGRVAAVLDPALYYGDPAVDLAYLEWTDTVGDGFLDGYRERRALGDGWTERRRVYEVVPLLEHLRVFGKRYLGELRATLSDLGY